MARSIVANSTDYLPVVEDKWSRLMWVCAYTIVVNLECHISDFGSTDCLLPSNYELRLLHCSGECETLDFENKAAPRIPA